MKKWKDIFVSREKRFFAYLMDQMDATITGMELLLKFMKEKPEKAEREHSFEKMSIAEKHGDQIRRDIITSLKETFVTPIDREDIYALSRTIDNILDYADSTMKELALYAVEPTPSMIEMVGSLYEAVLSLRSALANLVDDHDASSKYTIQAKKMENRVESLYRFALAELFESDDIKLIVKIREIYRHLSNAADRVDEAADIIGSIVIKGNV